jgi:uncharacterized membrane protein YcaP (DUF421 family)
MALILPYLKIVVSSVVVYLFIVLAIRIFGKKELSQLSVLDLVFILLISNAVQNAMVGNNTTLSGGLAAAAALFGINYLFKYLLYRFPKLGKIIQGEAVILIYHGRIIQRHLRENQITFEELNEAIREHGVATVEAVDLAILEIDGNISILSDDFKRRSIRKRKAHKVITKMG